MHPRFCYRRRDGGRDDTSDCWYNKIRKEETFQRFENNCVWTWRGSNRTRPSLENFRKTGQQYSTNTNRVLSIRLTSVNHQTQLFDKSTTSKSEKRMPRKTQDQAKPMCGNQSKPHNWKPRNRILYIYIYIYIYKRKRREPGQCWWWTAGTWGASPPPSSADWQLVYR